MKSWLLASSLVLALGSAGVADANGTVNGAAAGAVGGAVVGGPVGAVVGGVGGAVIGHHADKHKHCRDAHGHAIRCPAGYQSKPKH
jgi:hypothetical protein